jgi:hypothetical protein
MQRLVPNMQCCDAASAGNKSALRQSRSRRDIAASAELNPDVAKKFERYGAPAP